MLCSSFCISILCQSLLFPCSSAMDSCCFFFLFSSTMISLSIPVFITRFCSRNENSVQVNIKMKLMTFNVWAHIHSYIRIFIHTHTKTQLTYIVINDIDFFFSVCFTALIVGAIELCVKNNYRYFR